MEYANRALDWAKGKASDVEEYIYREWLGGNWTPAQIPNLQGKVAVVTGGNSGIGFEVARKLCENNAQVLMVSRDEKLGQEAANKIRQHVGKAARIDVLQCDMAVLRNVAALVREIKNITPKVDLLINNAGVFHPGPYNKTEDGIEQTLAINYYAHALLTLGLLDTLRATPGSRCLFVSSPAETSGKLDFHNLTGDKYKDSGLTPYGTSKVYMMMFSKELAARVPEVHFFCVHPGLVLTPLQNKASFRYITAAITVTAATIVGQPQYRGAYSTLYAATSPDVEREHWGYWGPNNMNMYPTTRREPFNRAIHNPVSTWKLFEDTVSILEQKLGKTLPLSVPKHPDDVYGSSERSKNTPPYPATRNTQVGIAA